jgi:ribonuclease P protein subunit RPR2
MNKKFKKREEKTSHYAREVIDHLFKEAEKVFPVNKARANRYVAMARKTAMKYRIRILASFQRQFCKHCHSYLYPGKNLRVRTQKGHVVYYCLECKKFMRFPYKK